MKDLKIFLGSPVDVKDERILVGSIIRKLNERYEPSGMRIHLYMWEDFPVEYKGVSKQEEYNKELVSQSDIAIFLFKKEIGACTLEEYRVAKEKGLEIHSYLVPHFSESIKEGLNKEGIRFMELESENQMELTLDGICGKYSKDNCSDEKDLKTREKYNFYATYGCDLTIADEHMFSNIIRYLDDFSERLFNKGCYLHLKNIPALLKDSDYYASFFKSSSNEQNESDFKEALNVLNNSRLRDMTVFQQSYKDSTPIHKEDSYIGKTLSERQIFTTSANPPNVKLILTAWLLRLLDVVVTSSRLNIVDDKIIIHGNIIALVGDLNLSDEIKKLPSEISRLTDEYNSKMSTLSYNEKFKCEDDILNLMSRLKKAVSRALLRMMDGDGNLIEENNYNKIKELFSAESADLESLKRDCLDCWMNDLAVCINSLKEILKSGNQDEIGKRIDTIIEILRKIEKNSEDKKVILYSLYDLIKLFDLAGIDDSDISLNKLYGEVHTYSSKYNVATVDTIMFSMNYANFLLNSDKDRAFEIYDELYDKIKLIDDSVPVYRYYIAHFYTNTMHSYMDLVRMQSRKVSRVISDFENTIAKWKERGWDVYEVETFLLAAKLKNVLITKHDPGLLKRAEDLFKDVAEGHVSVHEDNFWDVYCYFPHIIASYYLDRLSISDKKIKTEYEKNKIIEYKKNKIIEYENKVLRYLESSYISVEKEVFKSFVYHNLGFLHAKLYWDNHKMEHYKEARKWYDKSLSIRRNFDEKNLIIETLVNINGLMQIPKSLEVVEDYKYALDVVNELYRMAKDLNRNRLYSEEDYYEAVLAYCTMHYKLSLKKVDGAIPKEESLNLLKECYEWSRKIDNNDKNEEPNYARVIKDEYDIIMEHEKKIKS